LLVYNGELRKPLCHAAFHARNESPDAPLAIRERVVFSAERLRAALAELTQNEPVKEAAILSTCNRTELYCALGEPQAALQWLAGYHRFQPQELKPYLYALPQEEASGTRFGSHPASIRW